MPKLTPKQKAFCEAYIETGNASEAIRRAGYSPKNADVKGAQILVNPSISAYIAERMAKIDDERISSADEVLRFYSSVMRGEMKDQFGLEASLDTRLKAADSLMKRYAVSADRNKGAMEKLDNLLKEFKDAVKSETD